MFIHGFTGHPERTWAHTKVDGSPHASGEPPSKARKLNLFPASRRTVFWPRDLLPITIPDARVLTYGYDTHIKHKLVGSPITRNTVYVIAGDFLVALEAERRLEPLRPVLFIVHSLGGIVVKEMLRRSSRSQEHLRNVFNSTIGIMFFGTPDGGANPLGFTHRVVKSIAKGIGFQVNEQLVDTLLPSSERLRELRDEFGPMAQEESWIIHSFQEQLGVRGLNGKKVCEN